MKTAFAALAVIGAVSLGAQAAELDSLSKTLARGADALKNKKVAVLAFPYHDGKMSSGSSVISERLTTELVGKRQIRVIERRLIQQLLEEKKLDETGLVDSDNLKAIGSVLDADAIVTGTLIDLDGGRTEINARMIQSDSGEVLAAAREVVRRTWEDNPISVKRDNEPPAGEDVLSPEELSELNSIQRQPVSPPQRLAPSRGKNAMKLSNESFPAGRRLYHSNNQPSKSPKTKSGQYESPSRYDDGFDSGYQEGYYDAARDNINHPAPKQPSYGYREPDPAFDQPTLQHPTRVGTVQEDYPAYSYPSYPSYKTKSYNSKFRR